MPQTKYRICPLCEATCGLQIEVEGRTIKAIRGDDADVFSQGFICPKATALADLDADPDRLRQPLVRRNGRLVAASWDEAFAEVEQKLLPIIAQHGNRAVGLYIGNPTVHNIGLTIYGQALARSLRTPNIFSASSVDQVPKQLASALMFGTFLTVSVPDIERCDFLMILGANPLDSNGSLWTVPDFPGRLRALQKRGGRCVVIDPRRSRTARAADEHFFIRPGTDAHLLAAIAQTLFADGLVRLGRLQSYTDGVEALRLRASPRKRSPRRVALRRRRSDALRTSLPRPSAPPSTGVSGPVRRSSEPSPAGSSTCATCLPATSIVKVA